MVTQMRMLLRTQAAKRRQPHRIVARHLQGKQ
jgi:hypothetical protein